MTESTDMTVIPPAGSDGIVLKSDDVVTMKDSIGEVLKGFDSDNPEMSRGLAKIWEDCFRFQDTNELVRTNLYQIQVLLQKAFDEHINNDRQNRKYLAGLADVAKVGNEAEKLIYKTECERVRKDRMAENAQMMKMADTAKALANEYRQCRTTQSYFLHITKVQQFALIIQAIIHQYIHQPDILQAISKAIKNASSRLLMDMEDKVTK
jgi:hypothetical protein